MKTIAISSSKGGTGKSTFTVMNASALRAAGYRVLVLDCDLFNHSSSFYFNAGLTLDNITARNMWKVFAGAGGIRDNIFTSESGIDFVHGDVRLQDFTNLSDTGRLKAALQEVSNDYDYVLIDNTPALDKIVESAIIAANILIIPVVPHLFVYQTLCFYFEKLKKINNPDLDIQIVINGYEKPRTDNKEALSNQRIDVFQEHETYRHFLNSNYLSRSKNFENYTQLPDFRLSPGNQKTRKQHREVLSVLNSIYNTQLAVEAF